MTTTDRPASDVQGVSGKWGELSAAAHRLEVFCRAIEQMRPYEHDHPDAPIAINCAERAAWCEAINIGELVAAIPSPFDDTTREE